MVTVQELIKKAFNIGEYIDANFGAISYDKLKTLVAECKSLKIEAFNTNPVEATVAIYKEHIGENPLDSLIPSLVEDFKELYSC